jgi:hypothetical protein
MSICNIANQSEIHMSNKITSFGYYNTPEEKKILFWLASTSKVLILWFCIIYAGFVSLFEWIKKKF